MKKGIITMSVLAIIACTITAYCWATGNETVSERAYVAQSLSGQQVKSTSQNAKGKLLVVYFSVPETDGVDASSGASRIVSDGKIMGNTQYIASVIGEATGSTLFELKTAHTYPGSHKGLLDATKAEIDNNVRPELATHIKNFDDYDTVFVGFPNWWYDMPMPLYSFFDEYDFGGKTIIPFCTHGGSRFSGAVKTIRNMEKDAIVLDGYAVARDFVGEAKPDVLNWLKKIGMLK
ncbi:MAG: flavodoxin [Alistipes sp.]|uniref:flavodoxin n=1 Tax=Alistipes sp. TaxID=1872444 RepID=UPI0025B8EC25|nr:flavodoxin [Alistipes sp.]MCD8275518.1 flavodoxin [Alistipes sp.]